MKNEPHPVTLVVKSLILQMVSRPRDLRVIGEVEDGRLDIYVIPAQTDFRIVCGKKGRMINSLKFLAERAGRMSGQETELHLEESFRGEIDPDGEFAQNPEVDVPHLLTVVRQLTDLLMPVPREITHQRDNDVLNVRIQIDENSPEEEACVMAISDVLYAIAYRSGIICRVAKLKTVAA